MLREVVTKYIKLLEGKYGTRDPLIVTWGKCYEYLGIAIDFNLKLGVSFSQYDYIKKIINNLQDDLKYSCRKTPAIDQDDTDLY